MLVKFRILIKTFLDPILIDNSKDISDKKRRPLEEAILCLPGKELQKHVKHCIEHSLLTERELKAVKETMLLYVETVSLSLIDSFPEMDFIIDNTSFLDPSLRQLHRAIIPALVERFNTNTDQCNFDVSVIST